MTATIAGVEPVVRPALIERLPGSAADDPFVRLAAAWLVGHGTNTAAAYRRDLQAWSTWCAGLGVHPQAAERHHVDLWVRHLTTEPQPRTGRPASAATVARKLSALSGFYDFGVHDAEVLTHSPVASVRRPKVSDDSQAIGLTADEPHRLLTAAAAHSPRSAALVTLLTFCGLRISEALGADLRHYGHDHGHRVLKVTRKGGKTARMPLGPPVVRARRLHPRGHQRPDPRCWQRRPPLRLPARVRAAGPALSRGRPPRRRHPAQPAPLVRNREPAPGRCTAGRPRRPRPR